MTLLPFVFFVVIVLAVFGMFWALFNEDRPGLALVLFITALVMVFPMLGTVQAGRAHTEQDLVVTESGKVSRPSRTYTVWMPIMTEVWSHSPTVMVGWGRS